MGELVRMVARTRRVASLTAGSLAALGSLAVMGALTTGPAAADSICPTTLLPGQLCSTVDTVVGSLTTTPTTQPTTQPTTATTQPTTDTTSPPTTAAPAPAPAPVPTVPSLPVPSLPLLPGPTSPVPDPSSPPSNEGTAPASSTSPGAGDASPASHPATTNPLGGSSAGTASIGGSRPVAAPIVNGETARGFDLPALSGNGSASSPFSLDPAPLPSTNAGAQGISNELAAPLPAARDASHSGPSLPRPGAPITLAVLLVAGVLGAHGVRWIDRQMATATTTTTTR